MLEGLKSWVANKMGYVPMAAVEGNYGLSNALESLGRFQYVGSVGFNGEKNLGELGPMRDYYMEHQELRMRSHQLFVESEICQIALKRYALWVISTGLKLQAEPSAAVLESEGIKVSREDLKDFKRIVEARFKVFAESADCDYKGETNLNMQAFEGFMDTIVGGDVLVVQRYEDGQQTEQLIDGYHVQTPFNFSFRDGYFRAENGNAVRHGVELDAKGRHVAYYVRKGTMEYERIEAYGAESNERMAFLWYGTKNRIDDVRGVPLILSVMESAKTLDRYKSATLTTLEERAKVVLSIEHGTESTGENPMNPRVAQASGRAQTADLPKTVQGEELANKVIATTNKQVVNMPKGAKLQSLKQESDPQFKDFFTINIDIVFAVVGIPPNVAMGKYDDSFSASRAALKDWEHTLLFFRYYSYNKFYKHIYTLWLDIQVLTFKVNAPGYLMALYSGNRMALGAYRMARFTGPSVPHIDPLKEVKAVREKLGPKAANIPLTTVEAGTESLNEGDSGTNMNQFSEECAEAVRLGLIEDDAEGEK